VRGSRPGFVLVLVLASGCVPVRAWERGALAHPTMTPDSSQGPAEEHMRSVHEGATGGTGAAAGGGCGCN
jgi:hypothetical protein